MSGSHIRGSAADIRHAGRKQPMKLELPPHLAELNPDLVAGNGRAQKVKVGDGYKSVLERRAVTEWILPHQPLCWHYEALTFILPGGRYTPDFLMQMPGGTVWIVEVKGWNKNLRADKLKFNAAAEPHPWARWCWLTWSRHIGWVEGWPTQITASNS
jgi:hypothetical protein